MSAEHRHPGCVRSTAAVAPGTGIPLAAQSALDSYREHHLFPGDTLRLLLSGDSFTSFARADGETKAAWPAIMQHVLVTFHPSSYGTPTKFADWLALRPKQEARGG